MLFLGGSLQNPGKSLQNPRDGGERRSHVSFQQGVSGWPKSFIRQEAERAKRNNLEEQAKGRLVVFCWLAKVKTAPIGLKQKSIVTYLNPPRSPFWRVLNACEAPKDIPWRGLVWRSKHIKLLVFFGSGLKFGMKKTNHQNDFGGCVHSEKRVPVCFKTVIVKDH